MLKHEIIPKSDKLPVASLCENLSTILGFTYRNESTDDRHENILQWCVVDRPGTAQPSPALKKKIEKLSIVAKKQIFLSFLNPQKICIYICPKKVIFASVWNNLSLLKT